MPEGQLPFTKDRPHRGRHCGPRTSQFYGCIFRLQPDQHGSRRLRKDLIRHSAGNLLLSGNVVWTQERRSNLQEVSEPDVSEADRRNYGGIHRRHAGKIHHSRSPHRSSFRGIPDPKELQHETKPSQMCLRRVSRQISGFHSQS